MSFPLNNFYARWRQQYGAVSTLREGSQSPPERLLQSIWQQQCLRRDRLVTFDGRTVRILHPGFISMEGGPDFRGAVIQFDDEPPVSGDIEVDLEVQGWKAHGHDRNPNFHSVMLHVVWAAPAKAPTGGPPLLVLVNALNAPLADLTQWLGGNNHSVLPEAFRGRCSSPLRALTEEQLLELLRQAARVRLCGKASQLAARARESGWEQSLWEGLFRALGYKHNTWPMQRLAELRPRWTHGVGTAPALQARLLGIAGLLPRELTRTRPEVDGYVRRLWDDWWRERDAFDDCLLPRSLWRLHGIRPVNHPQRRLALAAHWVANRGLISALEKWGMADGVMQPFSTLATILQPARDDFWTSQLTLRSGKSTRPQTLLGEARLTDLAINVILPWLWARAARGGNQALQTNLEIRYCEWPAGEDNSLLKLARQRLLGGAGRKLFRTAAAQQGLLQILGDFCKYSNAVCDQCGFPELVHSFRSGKISRQ